jgi:hypothetical protein
MLLTTTDNVIENARWARPGAGEESDRHPLHVVEHRLAQLKDELLTDPRGLPPLNHPHHGVDQRDAGDHQRQHNNNAGTLMVDDHVDHTASDQRRRHGQHRRH